MKYKLTQKVIKIGDSAGVILPAKELKKAGIKPGDLVDVNYQLAESEQGSIALDYEAFKAQYSETLRNLADR